ncbi:MAG: hypothetical protein GY816_23460 [Cytophagales bacterium]|nr:hypothetical protein [Cytophagales bacterium]
MLRLVLMAGLFQLFNVSSFGQLKKFYTLKEINNFDTVNFNLKAASGNTYIKNYEQSDYPLVIYGNPDLDKINPSFNTKFVENTCNASLELDSYNSVSFGDGFSFVVSKRSKEEKKDYWKILLNQEKVYRLNMKYGVGNTDIDLSDVKLYDLRLNSGSANVKVGYQDDKSNLISMDTFYIKVDFGSIKTRNLGNARAKTVIADIGFGTALLDFSKMPTEKFHCDAKVGAGSLDVLIPDKDTPVIIYLKDSPFCGIRMDDDFEEVENNVYVNHSYAAKAKNLMKFNIDLALGNVSFQYSE